MVEPKKKKAKKAYSRKQILLIIIIVLFVFPVLFKVFSALAWTPFFIFYMNFEYPTEGVKLQIVSGVKLLVYFIGLGGSAGVCYKIWPKRALKENEN